MTILDSNIWIALFNENDSLHQRAILTANALNDNLVVPEYVVTEVCTVLTQNKDKNAADLFIEKIRDADKTTLLLSNEIFFNEILVFFRQSGHHGLSFIDVSLLWLARTHRVITFDRQLAKAIAKQT